MRGLRSARTEIRFRMFSRSVQFAQLRKKLERIIDPNTDSLRYYYLGSNWKRRVEHVGAKAAYDPEGVLMV